MSFDSRKQSIPKVFVEKIGIDVRVDVFRKQSVVDFKSATKVLAEQNNCRRRCMIAIGMMKPEITDGGSSGGGSNIGFITADAIAA